jgi:hypothetical protein
MFTSVFVLVQGVSYAIAVNAAGTEGLRVYTESRSRSIEFWGEI